MDLVEPIEQSRDLLGAFGPIRLHASGGGKMHLVGYPGFGGETE